MKVFVINLTRATDRRAYVEKQLHDAGIQFELYVARTPETSADYWQRVKHIEYFLNVNRKASPSEVACYASHQELWQKCVQLQEPIIILEDDFNLAPTFKDMLPTLKTWAQQAEFIRIEKSGRGKTTVRATAAGHELHLNTRYWHRTTGYLITPTGAEQLIKISNKGIFAPVDVFLRRFWRHGLIMHSCRPYLLRAGNMESTIQDRNDSEKIRRLLWPIWRIYRGVGDIRQFLFNRKIQRKIGKR